MSPEWLPWQIKAANKRISTYEKIPNEWRLSELDLKNASKQRKLTGTFIEKYISEDELSVTREPVLTLVNQLQIGTYSAAKVVKAFSRRAAVAHQIVRTYTFHDLIGNQLI